MGTRFGVALVATAVLVTACHGGGGKTPAQPEVPVKSAKDARVAVRDARVVRPMSFDGDALRIDVASGRPSFAEKDAIARFRASIAGRNVGQVTVAYGSATLRLPVSSDRMVVRPRTAPVFRGRAVWAIVWLIGEHSCPGNPTNRTGGHVPAPLDVDLIAADGSGEGAHYRTRGSDCWAPATGPTATVAGYELSIPWREGSSGASATELRIGAVPACAGVEGTQSWGDVSHPVVEALAYVLMVRPPCTRKPQPSTVELPVPPAGIPRAKSLRHAPTGPISNGVSDTGEGFTYFDGRTHTVPDPPTTAG